LLKGNLFVPAETPNWGFFRNPKMRSIFQAFFPGGPAVSGDAPQRFPDRHILDPACTPDSIEARSFAIIDAEAGTEKPFSGNAWKLARRLVHTAGDLSLLDALVLPDAAVAAGVFALRSGAPVFTDTEMVRAGIPTRRTDLLGVTVSCMLSLPGLDAEAERLGVTRARAGVMALGERLGGAIVAIGNAPTALLALLDYFDRGGAAPALVIAMPVGFVNAAEAKELLLQYPRVHALTLRGRRGGSPLAAAAVNALAIIALE
jgi:precorrin-8X/cobalt-precorrin-8 methylmutase